MIILDVIERNELANQIAKAGFTPDVDEMKMFLETGDSKYLKTFYNQKGEQVGVLTLANDTKMFGFDKSDIEEIKTLLNDYEQIRPDKKVEVVKDEEEVAEEARTEVDDILDGINIEVSVKDSVVLDNTMKKAYAKYAAKQTAAGKKPITLDKWINSEDGKNHRTAFIAVKKIWIDNDTLINPNNPLTEAEIQSESKLIPWLQSQEGKTNDLVQNVVIALGLTIDDVTGQTELLPNKGEAVEGNEDVKVFERGDNVSLLIVKTSDSKGNISTSYQLVDKYKQPLDEETLNRYGIANFGIFVEEEKAKALTMQTTLNNAAPDTTPFIFDDVQLNYGQLVYDQTGKEFIVLSQPKQVGSERKLLLVPSDEITPSVEDTKRATIPVKPGEFKASYSIQDLELKVLPQSVSRLNINEPIQPYAYRNKDAVTNQWLESPEEATARYNLVMSVLSPEELSQLELVVTLDPEGGLNNGYLIIPGFREANPYIQTITANYSVGIRTSNPEVQDKINAAIEKNGLNKSNSPNGVFGFMRNTNFIIKNSQGTVINPATMTADEYKNIIYVPVGMDINNEEDLKRAQNNFALNNLLSSKLPELVANNPNGVIALSKLEKDYGLSFVYKPGVMMYDKSPKPLADLQFSAADENGNYLIYQLEKTETGPRTKVAISNLEGEERRQLIDRVEESLTKQGLLDGITSLTDAYVAAVLLPDGSYALVNLKSETLESDVVDELLLSYFNQIDKNIAENKDNRNDFNSEFNSNINSKLFISGYSGYNFALEVNQYGKLQLSIKYNNTSIKLQLDKKTAADKNLTVDQKIQILFDQANETDLLKNAVSSVTNKVGFTISKSSFKKKFSREAGVQEILDKTTTQVAPQVVSSNAIQLTAYSGAIQAAKNIPVVTQGVFTPTEMFTDAEGNPIPKGPPLTTAPSTTDTKADIEKSRQEELNTKTGNRFYKQNPNGNNTKTTEVENRLIEKIIEKGIKDGLTGEEIFIKLRDRGFATEQGTDSSFYKDYLQERVDGTNTLKVGENTTDYINAKYDALEQPVSDTKAKKADIERRRKEKILKYLDTTFDNLDVPLKEEREQQQKINAEYDAELARELYKEMKAGKLVTDMTVAEQKVANTYITEELRKSVDAELAALEQPVVETNAEKIERLRAEKNALKDKVVGSSIELNILEGIKQELETLKAKLTEGLVGAAKIKAIRESKKYQDLLTQRKKLESEANKIVSIEDAIADAEDIDIFTAWATANLPEFISIKDIQTLGNNLKAGGVRVGAFVLNLNGIGRGLTVDGTLFTGAKSPFKYHEAFHGVFRMLLTDVEIKKYLSIARREVRAKLRAEGKSFEAELQRFRNSANTYSEMSRERLEQEYYEEYLADEFEKFKANAKSTQTDSTVKSLFTRIIEWIQSVFKSFTSNQLLTLFENIDAGKFKNTSKSKSICY
jgi:competence CoiA-like predicted nuclease